jgi:hypothetical protein
MLNDGIKIKKKKHSLLNKKEKGREKNIITLNSIL